MAENVRVAVRVRPFSRREAVQNCTCVVSMEDKQTTVHSNPPKSFNCDATYWSHDPMSDAYASQERVMSEIGDAILGNAFNGYNGCLFAYGQTGSGKTYSLLGEEAAPGVIPRTVEHMFLEKSRLESQGLKQVRVWVSYLEIYNDHLYDLLEVDKERPMVRRSGSDVSNTGSSERLSVREHPRLGVYVPGLNQVPSESPEDVRRLLDFGTKRRALAATAMNDHSSRSHAVFSVKIQQLDLSAGSPTACGSPCGSPTASPTSPYSPGRSSSPELGGVELHSKINLVDLAGAERQSKVHAEGLVMKQGCAINKGLSALALVIKELSDRQAKRGTAANTCGGIPFRASKLTWLLKDSLAGNSKTHMLANISPADESMGETISTLRFAASVKAIKTVASQNRCSRDELVKSLRRELEELRAAAAVAPAQQLQERERLLAELTKDYAQQIETAKQIQKAREEVLRQMAISADGLHAALGVDSETPYLMNMAACPSLAGCLLYYLPKGEQRSLGSADSNAIVLQGLGIPEHLCTIENKDNRMLILRRAGEIGRVLVNGRAVAGNSACVTLNTGDRLCLGRAVQLRLSVPALRPANGSGFDDHAGLILQGLEDEVFGIEESPSWAALHDYLVHVVQHMPADQASALCDVVRSAARLCDEANEISAVCRPDLDARFEVRLTSGSPATVLVCMMRGESSEPVYNWTTTQTSERLERMRECYQVFERTKQQSQCDDFDDPWKEVHPGDVWARMRDLETRLEDATIQNEALELKRKRAVAKGLLLWSGFRSDGVVRIAFHGWSQWASQLATKRTSRLIRGMTMTRTGSSMGRAMSRSKSVDRKAAVERVAAAVAATVPKIRRAPGAAASAGDCGKAQSTMPLAQRRTKQAAVTPGRPLKAASSRASPTPGQRGATPTRSGPNAARNRVNESDDGAHSTTMAGSICSSLTGSQVSVFSVHEELPLRRAVVKPIDLAKGSRGDSADPFKATLALDLASMSAAEGAPRLEAPEVTHAPMTASLRSAVEGLRAELSNALASTNAVMAEDDAKLGLPLRQRRRSSTSASMCATDAPLDMKAADDEQWYANETDTVVAAEVSKRLEGISTAPPASYVVGGCSVGASTVSSPPMLLRDITPSTDGEKKSPPQALSEPITADWVNALSPRQPCVRPARLAIRSMTMPPQRIDYSPPRSITTSGAQAPPPPPSPPFQRRCTLPGSCGSRSVVATSHRRSSSAGFVPCSQSVAALGSPRTTATEPLATHHSSAPGSRGGSPSASIVVSAHQIPGPASALAATTPPSPSLPQSPCVLSPAQTARQPSFQGLGPSPASTSPSASQAASSPSTTSPVASPVIRLASPSATVRVRSPGARAIASGMMGSPAKGVAGTSQTSPRARSPTMVHGSSPCVRRSLAGSPSASRDISATPQSQPSDCMRLWVARSPAPNAVRVAAVSPVPSPFPRIHPAAAAAPMVRAVQ